MCPPRHLIALIISLAALLAAGLSAASADEEPEQPNPSLSILAPGHNYFGWVGPSLSVANLKRRFPEIESIRAWDALRQKSYEPTNLDPGMGVRVTLSGDDPVEWQRPMTPVKSRVELQLGRNLIAWLGPDNWPIERVVLGIGRAFIRAEWAGSVFDPSLEQTTDSMPLVKRGDALWIEASRKVNWLQPAGVMPIIKFAGEAGSVLESVIRNDSVDVMNYYSDEFGLQPDGSLLTVYIAADLDSILDQFKVDSLDVTGVPKLWYSAGGWANPNGFIVLKLEQWKPDFRPNEQGVYGGFTYGRGVMAHEYYHAIQQQTSNTNAASWLVEGGADWAEAGMRRRDAESSFEEELAVKRQSVASGNAPPLDHAERKVEDWQYTLGALASHRLALSNGEQSLLEFWRALLPEPLGPLGRWQSEPPWQSVFQDVFGFTVDDFYGEFANWRGELAPLAVRGRVVGPDGDGLPYVKVVGRSPRLEDDGQDFFSAHTDGDGNFILSVSGLGFTTVGVDLGGCEVYYTSDGLVSGSHRAEQLSTTADSSQSLRLNVSDQTCVWRISGQVVDRGEVVTPGARVHASSDNASTSSLIGANGSFAMTVPAAGSYRLSMNSDGCSVNYLANGQVGSYQSASQIKVVDSDADGIRFVLPDGVCSSKIVGVLLDAEGNGIANTWVHAQGDDGNGNDQTDSDGAFTITLPSAGQYRLSINLDGCSLYYKPGGATGSWNDASQIQVSDTGVKGLRFQLSEGACATKIAGQLLDAEGNGIANTRVYAQGDDGNGNDQTDSDGAFTITLPSAGQYRLSINLDGCWMYYRPSGATGSNNDASQIQVSDTGVKGLRFQLQPGACSTKITGQLLDAEGNGIANTSVFANADSANAGAQTDADGSYSISVPSAGTYRVSTRIDGCNVYYRDGGVTGRHDRATQIRVRDESIEGIDLNIPTDLCIYRISGRLLSADGSPRSSQWVTVSSNSGSGGAQTDSDGSFSFAVPSPGSYRVSVWIDGCSIYRGSRGPTRNWSSTSTIRVSNADVTGIEFRLPENPSTFCN